MHYLKMSANNELLEKTIKRVRILNDKCPKRLPYALKQFGVNNYIKDMRGIRGHVKAWDELYFGFFND